MTKQQTKQATSMKSNKAKVKSETAKKVAAINTVKRRIGEEIAAASSEVSELAKIIALPGYVETKRYSTNFSSKKSAVAGPFEVVQSDWGQETTGPIIGETLSFLFRSPVCSSVTYIENSDGLQAIYQGAFSTPGGSSVNNWYIGEGVSITGVTSIVPGVKFYIPVSTYINASSGDFAPHGQQLYTGKVRGYGGNFVYMDPGTTLAITGELEADSGNIMEITLGLDYYDGHIVSENFTSDTQPFTSGTVNGCTVLSNDYRGYFAPYLILNPSYDISSGAGLLNFTSLKLTLPPTAVFGHLPMPGFIQNFQSMEGVRVIGESLMYTNTSAALQRGGECAMVQMGNSESWLDFVTPGSFFSNVASKADSQSLTLEHGIYGFLKPTQVDDLDYKEEYDENNGIIFETERYLDEIPSFIAFAAKCPSPDGCIGYFTRHLAIEYLTTDTWRMTANPSATPAEWESALMQIRDLPQFYTNSLHIKDIIGKIGSAGKWILDKVLKYGPDVLSVAKAASKLFI